MMGCCLDDVSRLDDLPDDTLARFFEMLAEAQERRPLWRMPPRFLANLLRADINAALRQL